MQLHVAEVVHVTLSIFSVGASKALRKLVEIDKAFFEVVGVALYDRWKYMVCATTFPFVFNGAFEVGDRHLLLLQEAVNFSHDLDLVLIDGRLWGEERLTGFADLDFCRHADTLWWVYCGEAESGILVRFELLAVRSVQTSKDDVLHHFFQLFERDDFFEFEAMHVPTLYLFHLAGAT